MVVSFLSVYGRRSQGNKLHYEGCRLEANPRSPGSSMTWLPASGSGYACGNICISFTRRQSERQGRPSMCEFFCVIIPGTFTGLWNHSVVPPRFSSLIDPQLSLFHRANCKINNICLCLLISHLVTSNILLTTSYIKFHVIQMLIQYSPCSSYNISSTHYDYHNHHYYQNLLEKTVLPDAFTFLREAQRAVVND